MPSDPYEPMKATGIVAKSLDRLVLLFSVRIRDADVAMIINLDLASTCILASFKH